MKKVVLAFIVFAVIMAVACKKENLDENKKSPGYFVIEQKTTGLKSSSVASGLNNLSGTDFDLGNIKRTGEYYFILSNGGETPIFDIRLSCNNSAFTFSPERIPMLDASNKLTVQQILKVAAIHGEREDAIGYAPLMKKGENEGILTINGKTLDGKDTLEVKLDVKFKVNALVADLVIFSETDTIDFNSYIYYGAVVFKDSCRNSGLDKINSHLYRNKKYQISNTGNVPISISIFNRLDGFDPKQLIFNKYLKLQEGETSDTLELPVCENNNFSFELGFKINSNGTISDINKFVATQDGNIYFVLYNFCN